MTDEPEREPDPGLESALASGRRGEVSTGVVLDLFARWPLYVPSGTDFSTAPETFQPVIFETPASPMMAIFTAPDRMSRITELAPYYTRMAGLSILSRGMPGTGFVVNPATDLVMEIAADAVAEYRGAMADQSAGLIPMPVGRELTAFEREVTELALDRSTEALVIDALAREELLVPSQTLAETDLAELTPTAWERNGVTYLAVYSSPDFLRPPVTERATYVLRLPEGRTMLGAVRPPFGLIVNGGTAFEYLIEPEVVAAFG